VFTRNYQCLRVLTSFYSLLRQWGEEEASLTIYRSLERRIGKHAHLGGMLNTIAINALVVYMVQCEVVLMRETSITRGVRRGGYENRDSLVP